MQDQLDKLDRRLSIIEGERVALVEQSKRIEDNTRELLDTFNALKGAWKVLNWIGKLAKPITLISSLFGLYWAFKTGGTK
jgi:hypothetical protein